MCESQDAPKQISKVVMDSPDVPNATVSNVRTNSLDLPEAVFISQNLKLQNSPNLQQPMMNGNKKGK